MAHIILMNPELDQVETHKVDNETFLKVYDLLHPKVEDITKGMTFGQAARAPEIMEAVGLSIAENKTVHPASDPIEDIPAFGDAMANSSFDEPELEDVPQFGKQYRLTGGSGDKAISNGDSWKDSELEPDAVENNAKRRMAMNGDAAFVDSLQALFG